MISKARYSTRSGALTMCIGSKPWHQRVMAVSMLILALVGMTFFSGCGGSSGGGGGGAVDGGGGDTVTRSLQSYMMPGEISAVPAIASNESCARVG